MATKMKWRHQEDQAEHERLSKATAYSSAGKKSLAVQSERDNCDLNILVRRFGIAPLVQPVDMTAYGAIDRDLTLQGALEIIAGAERDFMRLPAAVREKFANDPVALLEAVADPDRKDELRELGLLKPLPAAPPDPPAAEPPVPPVDKK